MASIMDGVRIYLGFVIGGIILMIIVFVLWGVLVSI